MPHRADGWTISDEHPTRVIIRPSSAAVTVTVTHNDRIDRWTLRVTVFNLQLKPVLLARRARLRAPGRGHAGLLLQRRMNCLFITARGRKIRNSEPGGGCLQWPPPPNPLPRGEGGGRYCHNIAVCSGHCIDIDICDRGGGALFFTFPPAASTYKRVGKTCLIFLPNLQGSFQ